MEPSYHESLPGEVQIIRWPHTRALPEEEVLGFFNARGFKPTRWTNGPGEVYAAHSHSYRKILFCLEGSIAFSLPGLDRVVGLRPGDRLILPAGLLHGATVGPDGVVCIEAGGE